MTREEAIHILDNLKPTNTKSSFDAYVVGKAITMAIEALEQEPCDDAEQIDYHDDFETALRKIHDYEERQKQNDKKCVNCKLIGTDTCYMVCGGSKSLYKTKQKSEPCDKCKYFDGNSCQHYDYKVGYTQGYEDASKRFRQEPCDDVVSRQWLMRKATERFYTTNYFNHITKMIEEAPSVRPQEQTGHWIRCDILQEFKCSECRMCFRNESNYCPNCGAKMVEPQESEEQTNDLP